MWIRKRFDISERDLLWAAGQCLRAADPQQQARRLAQCWGSGEILATLSVRSGFDLLWSALELPPGSEVIMSGLTIPDMPRIVREHGLVPVGVDVDPGSLSCRTEDVQQRIGPRTQAVVVAHLFGGRCDLAELSALCRERGLLLIEDCAQAWTGRSGQSDPRCGVSMFSFGPIKTNTALAGGVFEVRDPDLLERMRSLQQRWPVWSNQAFLKRILKYAALRRVATRPGMWMLDRAARMGGSTHDTIVARAARGFPGPDFFRKIRRQPAPALLDLICRKLEKYDPARIDAREARGWELARRLSARLPVPGIAAQRPTFWVLTVLADDPQSLVRRLWKEGFDATRCCSLRPVGEQDLPLAQRMLDHLVYLPFDPAIPPAELDRMVRIVLESPVQAPLWWTTETAAAGDSRRADEPGRLAAVRPV